MIGGILNFVVLPAGVDGLEKYFSELFVVKIDISESELFSSGVEVEMMCFYILRNKRVFDSVDNLILKQFKITKIISIICELNIMSVYLRIFSRNLIIT